MASDPCPAGHDGSVAPPEPLAALELPKVVLFGRSGEEALQFFNLDLQACRGLRLLDCAGGPGTLSALARSAGVEILAVDPAYGLTESEF